MAHPMTTTVVGTVSGLWRFPVKSMGGESVDSAWFDSDGVDGDRRYAVRDLESGKVASAKRPRRWGALLQCSATTAPDGGVSVLLPDGMTLPVGSTQLDDALCALTGRRVRVEHIDVVGSGATAVYEAEYPENEHLHLRGRLTFPTALMTEASSFVDLSAVHLITDATLDAIAMASDASSVTSARFRPNVVVRTGRAAGYVEDDWEGDRIRLGSSVLIRRVWRTPRCIMTSAEQPGLERDDRIFRAIAREHRSEVPTHGPLPCAGVVGEVHTGGVVEVGDPVTQLSQNRTKTATTGA